MINRTNLANLLFLFLALICFQNNVTAQETSKNNVTDKISIKQSNISLSELLDIIDSETEFDVSYGESIISISEKFDFEYEDETVNNILKDVSNKYNITYKISGLNISVFKKKKSYPDKKITISGYIKEKSSGELLIGASVFIAGTRYGTVSNSYGFYSLTIPAQEAILNVSYVGYETYQSREEFKNNLVTNIELEQNNMLANVDLTYTETTNTVRDVSSNSISIQPSDVEKIPALLGEKDLFKVLQYMPGVRSGSEATAGLYIRGGGPDQNLIILDDAPVYNAMHLFGFFSVFNGNAIKNVDMYKGGFPARFGGRLSSVIDISMKDGNKKVFKGVGSIGLLSSNIMVEGPIKNNKSSFIVTGRRTYIDILAAPFNKGPGSTGYYFYDLNSKLNYEFSDKNKIYMSAYFGRDKLRTEEGTEIFRMYWQNATATLRWNHLYNSKLFSNTSFIFSNYDLIMNEETKVGNNYLLSQFKSGIRDFGLKTDFTWVPNSNHLVRFGFNLTNHLFSPSVYHIEEPLQDDYVSEEYINTLESALYMEDDWEIGNKLKINGGLRLSNLTHEGENYLSLEPRITTTYMPTSKLGLKVSYSEMNQYMHLLTSTGTGMPTDLWVPATKNVKPQFSRQYAFGVTNNLEKYGLTVSVEAYYKTMENILSYKEGATFLGVSRPEQNDLYDYEDAVTSGNGYSKGVELLIKKSHGRFTGWVGYTLSYTRHKFKELNNGKEFFPRHDRRHDISIVGMYQITPNIDFSATWVYGTGDAFTMATEIYSVYEHDPTKPTTYKVHVTPNYTSINGGPKKGYAYHYPEKNSFRMDAYHRLDLAFRFHKILKSGRKRIWEVGLYNAYNRKNPFYYESKWTWDNGNSGQNELIQYSLFQIIPSVSYTLKF